MATYNECDICGKKSQDDSAIKCFVQVGAKKTFREINPDYDGLPHINLECCAECSEGLRKSINQYKRLQHKEYETVGI